MIIELSEQAGNAMLDALSALMDGGSIELLTDDGRVLASLMLSYPAAMHAENGELEFSEIEQNLARAKGTATVARVVAADGSEIFSCDCGDRDSDAVVKLSSTQIERGIPMRIDAFRLAMP